MSRAPDQLAGEVQEGLLVVVVALCRDLVVLQILFPARSQAHPRREHAAAMLPSAGFLYIVSNSKPEIGKPKRGHMVPYFTRKL